MIKSFYQTRDAAQKIRSDHYDPLRHMSWVSQEFKSALAMNDVRRIIELQVELRGVEFSVVSAAVEQSNELKADGGVVEPKHKRKPKSELKPIQDEMNPVDCLRHGMATLARKVGGMGLDSVIAMTGHKDLKLADHYSKIDGEVQKSTSLKILEHIQDMGLNEVQTDKNSNVYPIRRVR